MTTKTLGARSSPTFTLAQTYELAVFPVIHADLYRVNGAEELEEIGLSPLPEGTVTLIEWPERTPSCFPADRIDIALSHHPALGGCARRRNHRLRQSGRAGRKAEKALREFLDGAGVMPYATRRRMPGDASVRSYARLILATMVSSS